jgi:NitT/TauT family transport system ATP-binding protein
LTAKVIRNMKTDTRDDPIIGVCPAAGSLAGSSPRLIDARGVTHRYGTTMVVDSVDFHLCRGESVAIVAPSGAGKTTLLRLLLGFERPCEGICDLHLRAPDIGIAFQEDNLLPWLSVGENASLFGTLAHRPASEPHARALLESLGLQEFKNAFPRSLSTGMKQKVGLARLLLHRPVLHVIDEAMANIDDYCRFRLCDRFRSLVLNDRASLLVVTHNPMDALHLADRIVISPSKPLRFTTEYVNPLPHDRDYKVRFTDVFGCVLEELRQCIEPQ